MIKEIGENSRKNFDELSGHPLQSWAWGNLRRSERVEVLRLGEYKKGKLSKVYQISFHKVPLFPWKIGYCPKSLMPNKAVLERIKKEAVKRKVIMVKFEPNIPEKTGKKKIELLKKSFKLVKGRPLFTKFTFWLDISKDEEELMAGMKSKTRYNVKLAEKKGVKVVEDSSSEGFEEYWKLMEETTKRQVFYAHDKEYHLKMWKEMREAGQAYLLKAVYKEKTLSVWIVFLLNGVLYYPYGASSREHRELMANNLLAWEVIKFGKEKGAERFDMWGSLGHEPDKNDPWYGFHRFKEGYGGELVEFVGSWDLIVSPFVYWLYRLGEKIRWPILRLKKKLLG